MLSEGGLPPPPWRWFAYEVNFRADHAIDTYMLLLQHSILNFHVVFFKKCYEVAFSACSSLRCPPLTWGRVCVCVCVCVFAQLPLTLCDPLDCSLLGSPVRAIFQARTLDFVAICYSRACCGPRGQTHTSCISCIGRWILYHCATWEAPRFGYFCFSFYWSIIVLKSCVHFYCTAKWISYTYTHISLLLWISLPFRSPQSTEQSILCYTVGSHWLSILYILYAFYIQCI